MATVARIFFPVLVLCRPWLAYANVDCRETGAGRFPDPYDDKCKNYTICIYVKDTDVYITHNTLCPDGTVFDPKTSKCVSEDKYDCSNRAPVAINPEFFKVCSYDGYIADPEHTNCTTYIQCVNILGTYTQLRHSCPVSTYFNPNTTFCEPNYICSTNFRCLTPGRFADTSDSTSHKYFYCIQMSNGTYTLLQFTCPGHTMFNPITKLCTTTATEEFS